MITIRPMTSHDVSLGTFLSRQAGWNQREIDWERALALEPVGCFVALLDGVPAGTTTTCVFGKVAWVALVLVDERYRRRGLARALMEHALAFLDAQGVDTVRLDATPLGQPLYEQLGFVRQFRLARYEGVLSSPVETIASNVLPVSSERWPELLALDEAVTRTDRGKYLLRLFGEEPCEVRGITGEDGWRGLAYSQPGGRARQIGPCLGEAAPLLLAELRARHHGQRAYLDVPEDNHEAVQFVEGWGMTVQRHLVRMCRGVSVVERIEQLWASAGPAKG